MELKLAALDLEKIIRQRNMFAMFCFMVIVANLLLTLKIFSQGKQIVMVPGITREMTVSDSGVSRGYLEESSLLFLSAMLDLTPNTVLHKRDMILKYISNSDKKYLQQMKEYFMQVELEHKKFNLSTYFTPKNLSIDTNSLSVIAGGVLMSSFGKKGFEERIATYWLNFEYVGGHLKLKEFYEIISEDDKDDDKK